jgi:hypothetical protein
MFEVAIDQPAPTDLMVQIAGITQIMIPQGQTGGQSGVNVPAQAIGPGDYQVEAQLGAQTMTAMLHVI